jgi:AsmA protein
MMSEIPPVSWTKWRRRGFVLLLVAGLVALSAATATFLVNQTSLDARLRGAFDASSRLSLKSHGIARLSLFPWPSLRLNDAVLESHSSTEGIRTRIEAQQVRVRLNLFAFAKGQGAVTQMRLFQPRIFLTNTDGADQLSVVMQALSSVMDGKSSQGLRRLGMEGGVLNVAGTGLLDNLHLTIINQSGFGRRLAGSGRFANTIFKLNATLDHGDPAASTWTLASDRFAASFAGRRLGSAGLDAEGQIAMSWSDGGHIVQKLGLDEALAGALGSVAIHGNARVLWPSVQVRDAVVKLDETIFKGAVEASFAQAVPRLSATLATERLSIPAATLLAPATGKQAFLETTSQQLKALRGHADIRMSAMLTSIGSLPLGETALSLTIRPDRLEVALSQSVADGGQIKARGHFSMQEGQLRGRTSLVSERVPGDVFAALTGLPFARGSVSLSLMHEGAGGDLKTLIRSGNGTGSATITNGEVRGIDLQRLFARTDKAPPEALSSIGTTRVQSGSSKLQLTDGRLRFEDGLLRNPLLRAPFEGVIDLLNDTIDVTIRLLPPFDISRLGEGHVSLTGTLLRPVIRHEWRPAAGRT